MKQYIGIVEGFFSAPLKPWSTKERNNTLEFITQYAQNINTYFYCPKDDLYITQKWDMLYPVGNELKDIIQTCRENNIIFVYGLNPLITENVSWDVLKTKTINKLNQLVSLGCENICLLFDDIPLAYDVVDESVTKSSLYKELILFINDLYAEYKNQTTDFWVCLPDYVFIKETPLTKAIRKINKNIAIIWTGNEIFSKQITLSDIQRVQKILFKDIRLLYWSNYPVNDCEQEIGMFNLGGFYPLSKEVMNFLSGILVNPMREVYANLPFYITFSEFTRNPTIYSRDALWNKALQQIIGTDIKNIQETIKNFSQRNPTDDDLKWIISEPRLNITTTTKWGKLFLKSIQAIFDQAKIFYEIVKKIQNKELVSVTELNQLLFPTRLEIARYYPEIYKIVLQRLSLLPIENRGIPKIYNEMYQKYISTYVGSNKFKMGKKEMKTFITLNNDLVDFEINILSKFINRRTISIKKKLKVLSCRQNINRFFYK